MESKERAGGYPHALHATQVPSSYSCAGWACGGKWGGQGSKKQGVGREIPPGWKSLKTIAWQFDLCNAHAILIITSPSQFCVL